MQTENPLYAPRIAAEEEMLDRISVLEERCRKLGARVVVLLADNEALRVERVKARERIESNGI